MVPAMVGCLPLAEKGRSIRSATLPGQPAHNPAPALSQPIHLRALPASKCPGSSPAPITLDAVPIPRPLLALAPTVTTCYFVESSAADGSNCCTTVSRQMTMQIFMSFPSPGSGTRCQPTHFFSQTEETNICRIIGYLTPARVFSVSNESFPALHRGILIFRETVTIPQFSHLSKSFIKTSWNQQVWAENPRH